MTTLPTQIAYQLEQKPQEQSWLIQQLWTDQAVGIIGGEPKCCKSFLALDMAVSVTAGKLCLGKFKPSKTGRVLLYAAEDALYMVRQRLEGIANARQVPLQQLDIHVVTAPTVRLDLENDRERLAQTVAYLRPTMLVLDPFVRLHRCDENSSSDVAPLLAFLRELQRLWGTAVVVVHHAKKGGSRLRPGQALRGSSEFHAWGDSNLYLCREGKNAKHIVLGIEHRAANSPEPISLDLQENGNELALQVVKLPTNIKTDGHSDAERVLATLNPASEPLTISQIRQRCRMRMKKVCLAVADLAQKGNITKVDGRWIVTPN